MESKSWQNAQFIKKQQPNWDSKANLQKVTQQLKKLPPLVFAGEIKRLKELLAKVAKGDAFLLQGGSCAESFTDCSSIFIREDLKVLLQMALILSYTGSKQVVKVGRIAGQFAKPRSSDTELINGVSMPSYRGDMVNRLEANLKKRIANPDNLLKGYFYSAATLNLLRAFTRGGFASLELIDKWNQNLFKQPKEDNIIKT